MKARIAPASTQVATTLLGTLLATLVAGWQADAAAQGPSTSATKAATAAAVAPAGYVIGSGDVLSIVFWRDKEMSVEVVVRPDGKISLPLLNDVDAAGRTPEQLRTELTSSASKLIEDPNVTVVVKEINSRLVYITGSVGKAGPYPVHGALNVMQLIAVAGGLSEYADAKNIVIMRTQNGKSVSYKFNYKEVVNQKHPEQNIQLLPGDTVVVP